MNLVPEDTNISLDCTCSRWMHPDMGSESPDYSKYWRKSLGRYQFLKYYPREKNIL